MLVPDAADEDERVARFLALGEHHDVELAGRALGLGKLPQGAIQGLSGSLIRRMVGQEFAEEAFAQLDADGLARGQRGEFFARAHGDLVHGLAGFGGDRQAETTDVRVAQRRALAQLDHEFVVGAEHQRFGEGVDGDVRLGLVEALGRPAVARIVVKGVLHVAVVVVLLLVGHHVGDGVGEEDVADLVVATGADL